MGGGSDLRQGVRAVKIVASMIVQNELDRYLRQSVTQMLDGFVDDVVILDDGSTDGLTWETFRDYRVHIRRMEDSSFYQHEGRARQQAIDFARELNPTHLLVVDGDEILVHNGRTMREQIEAASDVWEQAPPARARGADRRRRHTRWPANGCWSFVMEEVWGCDEQGLLIRQDGGWRAHPVTILYRPDLFPNEIANRALASGRVPQALNTAPAIPTDHPIFHFGWARVAEREARYQRYVKHDGGAFHASAHLQSIMWPDERVTLKRRPWPPSIGWSVREELVRLVARP